MRVLICDDEPTVRRIMRQILVANFDCEVQEACDGLEALHHLVQHPCDLLVLDLHMPRLAGQAVLAAVRHSNDLKHLPVLVLTSERDSAVVKPLVTLGISDYLLKPPTPEHITKRLETMWARLAPSQPSVLPSMPSRKAG